MNYIINTEGVNIGVVIKIRSENNMGAYGVNHYLYECIRLAFYLST